ncbi:hypothetical protein GGQ87_000282 [Brevundimonas alba]|uniref:Uncharacterized protein n=1 Tax=Brevundimonas alba TaxID=74314 RepID=A0A7X6BMI8_9CAUL|nr:hypothetical protein [Brevundimonas alba]NJC40024.1 hypothetical protein [Brevundimonas alba]
MGFKLHALLTACVIALAAPAAAQTVDWNSESNRTWWNGVTGAEIRELAVEAGGVWTDLPDEENVRIGRIDWPDLAGVLVREIDCPTPERPMEERNCGTLLLSIAVEQPDDVETWWLNSEGWVSLGRVDNGPALYRMEHHAFGTTRGHVLSNLMLFRVRAVTEIARIAEINDSGW